MDPTLRCGKDFALVSLQGLCAQGGLKAASRQSWMAVPLGSALEAMLEALLQGSVVYSLVVSSSSSSSSRDRRAAE